ncbi:hypothetical protein DV737_g2176, partial [Chaetothyriales sp. CBS 132003]
MPSRPANLPIALFAPYLLSPSSSTLFPRTRRLPSPTLAFPSFPSPLIHFLAFPLPVLRLIPGSGKYLSYPGSGDADDNGVRSPQYARPQLQPQTYDTSQYGVPDIKNPFVPTPAAGGASQYPDYDPEYEAQVAQWQSAYVPKEGEKTRLPGVSATVASTVRTESPANKPAASQTVQRSGGGQTWNDQTLLEWDPAHFRIFVGNLAGEVTDDSLLKAFSKYPTVQKAKVIRDKRTTKSKGFGFVSFKDGDDYFQAAREMQGKYIGSHPDGIRKKNDKTKGGLRVLG